MCIEKLLECYSAGDQELGLTRETVTRRNINLIDHYHNNSQVMAQLSPQRPLPQMELPQQPLPGMELPQQPLPGMDLPQQPLPQIDLPKMVLNKEKLLQNLFGREEVNSKTLTECVTNPAEGVPGVLQNVLETTNKLSVPMNGHENQVSLYANIDPSRYPPADSIDPVQLQAIGNEIATKLGSSDISVVLRIISSCDASEFLTFVGTHHTLIGIIGLPMFYLCYDRFSDSSGNYSMIWQRTFFKLNAAHNFQVMKYFNSRNFFSAAVATATLTGGTYAYMGGASTYAYMGTVIQKIPHIITGMIIMGNAVEAGDKAGSAIKVRVETFKKWWRR